MEVFHLLHSERTRFLYSVNTASRLKLSSARLTIRLKLLCSENGEKKLSKSFENILSFSLSFVSSSSSRKRSNIAEAIKQRLRSSADSFSKAHSDKSLRSQKRSQAWTRSWWRLSVSSPWAVKQICEDSSRIKDFQVDKPSDVQCRHFCKSYRDDWERRFSNPRAY